jgi:hypothetical protein
VEFALAVATSVKPLDGDKLRSMRKLDSLPELSCHLSVIVLVVGTVACRLEGAAGATTEAGGSWSGATGASGDGLSLPHDVSTTAAISAVNNSMMFFVVFMIDSLSFGEISRTSARSIPLFGQPPASYRQIKKCCRLFHDSLFV